MVGDASKPVVKAVPFEASANTGIQRIGFMEGLIVVPDDFDRMGADEIEELFGSTE